VAWARTTDSVSEDEFTWKSYSPALPEYEDPYEPRITEFKPNTNERVWKTVMDTNNPYYLHDPDPE
jgi:hypothetical protein